MAHKLKIVFVFLNGYLKKKGKDYVMKTFTENEMWSFAKEFANPCSKLITFHKSEAFSIRYLFFLHLKKNHHFEKVQVIKTQPI